MNMLKCDIKTFIEYIGTIWGYKVISGNIRKIETILE
jgi:hypothetical protein